MTRIKTKFVRYLLTVFGILFIATIIALFWTNNTGAPGQNESQQNSQPAAIEEVEVVEPLEPVVDLQPTVDTWTSEQSGVASVVIYDLTAEEEVASHNPDKIYFGASIYKLYVAYIGYQKIADGTYSQAEPYYGDLTRGDCLDEMIRTSHSPCAEKMRLELGIDWLDKTLQDYGIQHSAMGDISTSASDVSRILRRLYERRDLTNEHADAMLASLKDQIYQDALKAGFSESTVHNKVGFRGLVEYHDVAVVEFQSGQAYVMSVLSENIGAQNIADLATRVETAVLDAIE
ncbi:MAG: serine hydrolase [Candidatus Saccharibacteria bacterium]|nr:serine hydrolase [Candidatus Saccharibacteria bacterium]